MKIKLIKHLQISAVFFVILSSFDISSCGGQRDSTTTATNKFAADLLKVAHKLHTKDENFVISTFSVYIVLAILQQASRGATQKELTAVIFAKPSLALQGCKSLIQDLKVQHSAAELNIAIKLYMSNLSGVKSDFKDCMEQNFLSEIQNLNFLDPIAATQKINLWVSNSTQNNIQNIIQEGDLSANAVSIFIMAAFFSGQWKLKFEQELTNNEEFTYVNGTIGNVSTMHMEKDLSAGHITEIGAKFVLLPFSCYNFQLLVILPDDKDGLKGVMDKLDELHLLQMMENQEYMHVNLSLPKFKFGTNIDVAEQLKQLGIEGIFNSNADFSGIMDRQFNVGQMRQKVNVEVNEEGASASASTSAILYQYSPGQPEHYKEMGMKVDHPFLFSIFDIFNRVHLFSGWVGTPS